ncbi:MAG: hypothetical protein KAJ48_06150 [Elusimicrobiales bacterium]|nr:hypothetical protein [Elusimicrobiales bacterium]
MKKNTAYVMGLILMFSTAGVYLNAQGMGGGYGGEHGFNSDDGMRMHQREGNREGMEMRHKDSYRDKRSSRKNIKNKKIKRIKSKKMGGYGNQDIEKDVLSTIKKHDSSFAKKLEKLKEDNARKYKLILRQASKPLMMCKRHGGDATMEKDMVEGIKLEYETRELSFKYKKASSSEKKVIEKSLKTKVSRLFDLRAKGQEIRIKNMNKEIGELQSKLKDRKAHKAEIVKTRVDKLTGQGYTW